MATKEKAAEHVSLDHETFEVNDTPLNESDWQVEFGLESEKNVQDEILLRLHDIEWRIQKREEMKTFLTRLLVGQNVLVFILVVAALYTDKIKGLEAVFTTLVGGTILQTTAMIHIIMKWLFSEIPYKNT